jgi:hypothetical protein|mmetsp:Transcript_55254/g.87622  ORF Transcript_55254/g.87622 Transcript_55254/m.87622 type:complete len:205 (-) Transcript_55254:59-673(-)
MEFCGMTLIEKNTFLDFYNECDIELCKNRRKSVPALHLGCAVACDTEERTMITKSEDRTAMMEHRAGSNEGQKATLVPEQKDTEEVYTVMIKNIPCSCKRADVLKAVEELGFLEHHEFFYMPQKHGKTPGYAFIGFPSPDVTREFTKSMTGYRFVQKASLKTVMVVPASIQGLHKNVAHFKDTSVMRTDARPSFQEPFKFSRNC